jgi:hypothetical protein
VGTSEGVEGEGSFEEIAGRAVKPVRQGGEYSHCYGIEPECNQLMS